MTKSSSSIFFNRLRYWSVHSIFCGGPNFIIAYISGWSNFAAILGMFAAILTYILIYTFVTSSDFYLKRVPVKSFLGEVIHKSAICRSAISTFGLCGIAVPSMPYLSVVDFWAGMAAIYSTEHLLKFSGIKLAHIRRDIEPDGFWLTSFNSFIPTYMTAFIEGLIITASLIVIVIILTIVTKLFKAFLLRRSN